MDNYADRARHRESVRLSNKAGREIMLLLHLRHQRAHTCFKATGHVTAGHQTEVTIANNQWKSDCDCGDEKSWRKPSIVHFLSHDARHPIRKLCSRMLVTTNRPTDAIRTESFSSPNRTASPSIRSLGHPPPHPPIGKGEPSSDTRWESCNPALCQRKQSL